MYSARQICGYLNMTHWQWALLKAEWFNKCDEERIPEEDVIKCLEAHLVAFRVKPLSIKIDLHQPLLTTKQVAAVIGVNSATIDMYRSWQRVNGNITLFQGPNFGHEIPFFKIGGKGVRYSLAEVLRWKKYRESSAWHPNRALQDAQGITYDTKHAASLANGIQSQDHSTSLPTSIVKAPKLSEFNALPSDEHVVKKTSNKVILPTVMNLSLDCVRCESGAITGHIMNYKISGTEHGKMKEDLLVYAGNLSKMVGYPWYIARYRLEIGYQRHHDEIQYPDGIEEFSSFVALKEYLSKWKADA